MPSRRTVLKAAALAGSSSLLVSQEGSLRADAARAKEGFDVEPGKSRRGKPFLIRGKDPTTIKVSGSDTGGQLAVFESTTSAGDGPELHKHAMQDEWWYVL